MTLSRNGVLLAALLLPGLSEAAVQQLDLSRDLNADVVVNDGGGRQDATQEPVDLGLIASGNFCFITQTVSDNTAVPPQTPDGLPDDAFFPAGTYHPDVQLAWRNDDDGVNAWRLTDSVGMLHFDLPPFTYTEFHVYATAGNGPTSIQLIANYDDGTAPGVAYSVPDWFDDPADTADRYALVNGRDRMQPGNGPGTLFLYEDANDAAIFGFRLLLDPTRTLLSVDVERTDTNGALNVFGALIMTDDPAEACCMTDGTCRDVGPAECSFFGGTAQGPGTDCAGTTCPQAEACCFMDGSCTDLLPLTCLAMGGAPEGPATTCASTTCPQFEACCFADGRCLDLVAADCATQGGIALGMGTTCAGSDCTSDEACCLDGGLCLDVRPAECAALSGIAQGASTACATTTCPTIPGWTPNGADRAGDPLDVIKAPAGDLSLSWGLGCSPDVLDHTVHEGIIGSWYSHVALACDTAGALTSITLTPGADDRYYLIVGITDIEEGSYGLDSTGAERPVSTGTTCVPAQLLGCP